MDEAVERVLDGETLDRRDGLTLVAQPVDDLAPAADHVQVDASLGILTEEQAEILAAEGIDHYNHNIETSPRYFPEVVETHSFEDRVATLEVAKDARMDLCAGVILGMGESPTDRVDAAIALQDVGVSSLPVNVLNPVAGTPMGEMESADITTEALIETIAVFRLLHPETRVRLTGRRSGT